jgi:hypothetical protein
MLLTFRFHCVANSRNCPQCNLRHPFPYVFASLPGRLLEFALRSRNNRQRDAERHSRLTCHGRCKRYVSAFGNSGRSAVGCHNSRGLVDRNRSTFGLHGTERSACRVHRLQVGRGRVSASDRPGDAQQLVVIGDIGENINGRSAGNNCWQRRRSA